MKSFLERLIFANLSYDAKERSAFSRNIQTGFVYTMGVSNNMIGTMRYSYLFNTNKSYLELLHGRSEYLISADNYQFDDYFKYAASNFDAAHKKRIKEKQFPVDCKNAYELGKRLVDLSSQHTFGDF